MRGVTPCAMLLWILWRFVYVSESPYGSAVYWETVWTYPTQERCQQSYLRRDAGMQRGDQDGAVQIHGAWLKIQEKRYECLETRKVPQRSGTIGGVRVYSEHQDVRIVNIIPGDR